MAYPTISPSRLRWLPFAAAGLLFALAGWYLLAGVRADSLTAAKEAESGQLTGNARLVPGAGASGGGANAVLFGGSPTTGGDVRVFAYRMFGGDDNPARIGPAAGLKRYAVYLLSPYMVQTARAIKQANPTAKVFMYKDPSSTRTTAGCIDDARSRDWGVDYCLADQSHPGWFMTKSGQRFQYSGYAGHWHMDVMAAGYKEQYVASVLKDLRATPAWDGVFLDNIMADIRAYVPAGAFPDQYPSLPAGQAAYTAFMDYAGPALAAAGYETMGNNNGARLYPGLWAKYTAGATGGYDEFWTTFGNATNLPLYDGVGWEAQMAEADLFVSQHKRGVFTAQTNGGSCASCRLYGYASYLLAADGLQAFAEGNADTQVGDWRAASAIYDWDLGSPAGSRSQLQPNLFQRQYDRGLVVVNADKTASRSVSLPAAYIDEAGNRLTNLTLPPLSGRILRSSN